MKIEFTTHAHQQIKKLNPIIRRGIRQTLKELGQNPYVGKPLSDELEGYWSVAHFRYRVVYQFDDKYIVVFAIEHRSTVYKSLL